MLEIYTINGEFLYQKCQVYKCTLPAVSMMKKKMGNQKEGFESVIKDDRNKEN